MNVYLISFTSLTNKVSRIDLQNFFNTRHEVLNWYGIMPQAILVVTNYSEADMAALLVSKFGNDITFILTKTEPNRTTGYINKEVWDFINNPRPSGYPNLSAGLMGGLLGDDPKK